MAFGGGVIPLLHGQIADMIGFQNSYFVPLLAAIIIFFFGIKGSRNVNLDIPVQ